MGSHSGVVEFLAEGRLAEVFALPEVWEFPFGRGLTREETATWLWLERTKG